MPTKLSRYAEGVMEAAWLAAIIVVPAFFNVYSSRIFEPDKLALLRSLALLICGVWIVKLLEEGGVRWEKLPRNSSSWFKSLPSNLRPGKLLASIPLIAPVIGLALVYLIATIFSVNPRVSLWGSYQRLQGTYTTFSYLVVFAALVCNLRRRAQLERLLTTAILTSLPVSLYGVLQHFQIDPVPWGGDVTSRIASNMGNSIFVAAYLIVVNPIALIRIIQSFGAILKEQGDPSAPNGSRRDSDRRSGQGLVIHMVRGTIYVFIAALQLIALYFSGSRGPWLGWMAGLFFLFIVLSLLWRKRGMTLGVIAAAILAAGFLLVLNLPNSPLQALHSLPGVGRLGDLLNAESRTGRVRTLIWRGAVELVLPHKPIEYPDGRKDAFNAVRPLIGYGPESMYVAYNPFYQPELTQVEKRNASPDRSHNETWDSLAITGALGLFAYLALFVFVFYHSLKWLGLITSLKQRNLFLGLSLACGVASAAFFVIWKEAGYFGVGLPFGIIIGILVYLTLAALFGRYQTPQTEGEQLRALTLVGLLAVIVAHFVEINFGIAIAVTRTYFWAFSALLLLAGFILPLHGEYELATTSSAAAASTPLPQKKKESKRKVNLRAASSRRKKRRSGRVSGIATDQGWSDWQGEAVIGVFVLAMLIVVLGYDFLSNPVGSASPVVIIRDSLTRLRSGSSPISYGVLMMILLSWLSGGLLLASESINDEITQWLKGVGLILGVSLGVGLMFWFWHAGGIASLLTFSARNMDEVLAQVGRYENILTRFYVYIFLLIFAGAIFLSDARTPRTFGRGLSGVLAPVILSAVFFLVSTTNMRIIQADIAFKSAEMFVKQDAWPVAIGIYNHANQLAPNEDYYYLFLGRAYLEHGRSLNDDEERQKLFAQAFKDLKKAQALSPLNIDHTANLARLNSTWVSYTADPVLREERAQTSDDYFARAVVLSPNNARIWDEWALLYLNTFKQPEIAYQHLTHSLQIDPYYDWTYALLGDHFAREGQRATDAAEKQSAFRLAADQYEQALQLVGSGDKTTQYNYTIALAGVYIQLGEYQQAITSYQQAIEFKPTDSNVWRIEETLTQLYYQLGERENALLHAKNALAAAPDDQKERLHNLINQLQNLP